MLALCSWLCISQLGESDTDWVQTTTRLNISNNHNYIEIYIFDKFACDVHFNTGPIKSNIYVKYGNGSKEGCELIYFSMGLEQPLFKYWFHTITNHILIYAPALFHDWPLLEYGPSFEPLR